ncbi:MAG: CmcI family methyltransferase [Dehalococcoidia bacterium]|jgi:cephalosporin hydroxylase
MNNYQKFPSLRKYVRTRTDKNNSKLEEVGTKWMKVLTDNRLNYEIDWLGVPIIQTPEDLVLMQELIFKVQPDFIIETGIAHGGGLIYYASLMELLGKGKVIGIDIDIREHNRKVIEAHPLAKRIEMIEGSSTSEEIIKKVRSKIPDNSQVIVCLDSDHTKAHVLKELELYKTFIIPGGYFVVFDTVISKLIEPGNAEEHYTDNSPREAVDEFLKKDKCFEIDKSFNKLFVSCSPDGYLKRIR